MEIRQNIEENIIENKKDIRDMRAELKQNREEIKELKKKNII